MDHRFVRGLLRAVPFRPFRLTLLDNRDYELRHRGFLAVSPDGRSITHYDRSQDDAVTFLEPLLIISIEYITPIPPPETNGPAPA
jgi:hypothetical protein